MWWQMSKMNTKYFIDKFEAIPREKWIKGTLHRKVSPNNDKYCALGHAGSTHPTIANSEESKRLQYLFKTTLGMDAFQVNDGAQGPKHWGKHPKDRILNALKVIRVLRNQAKQVNKAIAETKLSVKDVRKRFASIMKQAGLDEQSIVERVTERLKG